MAAAELEPLPYGGAHDEDELDLFGPYRHLYPVRFESQILWMPEGNSVLRGLQFVELKTGAVRLAWGKYCWSNTVGCCELQYREHADGPTLTGRGCTLQARPGLELVRLPKGGRACLPRP